MDQSCFHGTDCRMVLLHFKGTCTFFVPGLIIGVIIPFSYDSGTFPLLKQSHMVSKGVPPQVVNTLPDIPTASPIF